MGGHKVTEYSIEIEMIRGSVEKVCVEYGEKIKSVEKKSKSIFISKQEAANLLNCSERTIDSMRNEGMPFYSYGGKVQFKEQEILKWIDKNKRVVTKK